MPDRQPPPEIETLRRQAAEECEAWYVWSVALDDAERAVLDAVERRTREIVEALRAYADELPFGDRSAVLNAVGRVERSFPVEAPDAR